MANAWWACYGNDYAAKTGHLTMLQNGAYFTLLLAYYRRGEPLPVNNEQLVRLCRAHSAEEIEAISFILSEYFILKSDGWHNKRADEELKKSKQFSKMQSKRAHMRWHSRGIANAHAEPMPSQSQSQSHNTKTLKPTLEEVRAYCALRQNAVDPQKWFDHYAANGWRVGRNPMKDWKAAIRNWERNGVSNGQSGRNHQAPRAVERFYSNEAMFESELGVASQAKADVSRHEASNSPRTINALGAGAK